MIKFEELLDSFIDEAACDDYPSGAEISVSAESKKRSVYFIPINRQNLKSIFDLHHNELRRMYEFALQHCSEPGSRISSWKFSEQRESLIISITRASDPSCFFEKKSVTETEENKDTFRKEFEFKNKSHNFESIIESQNDKSTNKPNYHDLFVKFFQFVDGKILRETVASLNQEVSKLLEEKQSRELVKMPVNMFNVMLTNKSSTLEKIEGKIQEIEKAINESTDEKKLARLAKQKKLAKDILAKAKINFPEDFYFPVYQHYAIFGGMKLLHANNFKPTPFTATSALEALNFSRINKSEVTEIRRAFSDLTMKKFPCYFVRQDQKDPNVYHFSEADNPIFMIYEEGRVDLNVDLTDDIFARKNLYLCLLNPALKDDLQHFFSIIDSNILAKLRESKRVSEEDLYFIEFLIREIRFKKHTQTDLEQICKTMKKDDWLKETGKLDRDRKRRIKDSAIVLLNFSITAGLVKDYVIDSNGNITINYSSLKKEEIAEITHEILPQV